MFRKDGISNSFSISATAAGSGTTVLPFGCALFLCAAPSGQMCLYLLVAYFCPHFKKWLLTFLILKGLLNLSKNTTED